jgi:LuxR family transcriptional regulator, glucitol operon activator
MTLSRAARFHPQPKIKFSDSIRSIIMSMPPQEPRVEGILSEPRRQQLETLLEENRQLKFELEQELLLTTNPLERARLKRDLERVDKWIKMLGEDKPPDSLVPPLPDIPERRIVKFFGRSDIVKEIKQWLENSHPHLLILAPFGTGKTALIIEVSHAILGRKNDLSEKNWPKFSSLIYINPHTDTFDFNRFLNTIAYQIGARNLALVRDEDLRATDLKYALGKVAGQVLLMVDNLDLLTGKNVDKIHEFLIELPANVKILSASKDEAKQISKVYNGLVTHELRELRLKGFSEDEAMQFIRMRADTQSDDKMRERLQTLLSTQEANFKKLIRELNFNPYLIEQTLPYLANSEKPFEQSIDNISANEDWLNYIFDDAWKRCDAEPYAKKVWTALHFFVTPVSFETLMGVTSLTRVQMSRAIKILGKYNLIYEEQQEEQLCLYINIWVKKYGKEKVEENQDEYLKLRRSWIEYYLSFARKQLISDDPRHPQEKYWKGLNHSKPIKILDFDWPNLNKLLLYLADTNDREEMNFLVDIMLILVHYMHGLAYANDRIKFSEKAAEFAVKLDRVLVAAAFWIDALGYEYRRHLQYDEAEKAIRKGLELAKGQLANDSKAEEWIKLGYAFLARVYLERGNLAEAKNFEDLFKNLSSSAIINHRLNIVSGMIALMERDFDTAIVKFEQAERDAAEYNIEIEKYHPRYWLGITYIHRGLVEKKPEELEKAVAILKEVVKFEQGHVTYLTYRACKAIIKVLEIEMARFQNKTEEIERDFGLTIVAPEQDWPIM